MKAVETNREPYVGPRPFEESDRAVFFGRTQETSELVSLITAHQVVLLYAQSGAGKTSLVRAGLIPMLIDEEQFEVLPPMRVREQTRIEAESENVDNIFMFNCLMAATHPGNDESLNKHDWKKLTKLDLTSFLQQRKESSGQTDEARPTVLVFDQFEELFTLYPERWEERSKFFEQIQAALAEDPLLRVLLCMREDFIAELDPHAACLPEKLRTRFRIERLNKRTGLLAVMQPLEAIPENSVRKKFADGVAEKLIENLLTVKVKTPLGLKKVRGKFIEPLQLQVVCQSLWNNLDPKDGLITHDHVTAFGDVNKALSLFYENAIKRAASHAGVKIGVLRGWCQEMLITPAGTRGTVFRGAEETAGLKNDAVKALESESLIRLELRGGATWYELAHDRFVEIVQQSNHNWLLSRPAAEQTLLRLESKANAWDRAGAKEGQLLDEVELLEAQRWLQNKDDLELEPSKKLLAFVRRSESAIAARRREESERQRVIEEQARMAKVFRRLSVALTIVLLVAIVATVTAFVYWWQASDLLVQTKLTDDQLQNKKGELTEYENQLKRIRAENEDAKALNQSIITAQSSLYALNLDEAKEDYERLLRKYERERDKAGEAITHLNLGQVYYQMDKYPEAIQSYEKALAIWRESGAGPNVGFIYTEEAEVYMSWGEETETSRPKDAKRYYEKAKELYSAAMKAFPGNAGYRQAERGLNEASDALNGLSSSIAENSPDQ